jgi:hypothetical protein
MASASKSNNLVGMEIVSRSENLHFKSLFERDSQMKSDNNSGNSPAGSRLLSGFGNAMKKSL